MHSLGVVHGDIKAVLYHHHLMIAVDIDSCFPSQINILVDQEHNAQLADFGLVSALNSATNAATYMTGGGGGKGTLRFVAFDSAFCDRWTPAALGIWLQSYSLISAAQGTTGATSTRSVSRYGRHALSCWQLGSLLTVVSLADVHLSGTFRSYSTRLRTPCPSDPRRPTI
jgi:serine/threonine protein kinase